LAVIGVALAVVTTVLLGSLGVRVVEAGSSGLESAHSITAEVESREDVAAARAMHFQPGTFSRCARAPSVATTGRSWAPA
jgi:hypothetical protein